jgi:hypothetical protein
MSKCIYVEKPMITRKKAKIFFPKQSPRLFQYDELVDADSFAWTGMILRDDLEEPFIKIIKSRGKIVIFKKSKDQEPPSPLAPSNSQTNIMQEVSFTTKYCKKPLQGMIVRHDVGDPHCYIVQHGNYFFTQAESEINREDMLTEVVI